jgi:hypothetical protein
MLKFLENCPYKKVKHFYGPSIKIRVLTSDPEILFTPVRDKLIFGQWDSWEQSALVRKAPRYEIRARPDALSLWLN